MANPVDLRGLIVERPDRGAPQPALRRRIFTRYVIPVAIVGGFAVLIAWSARDRLLPSKAVTVVPVIMTRAEVHSAGAPLFQSAGWVEPRPGPVLVTALAEGIVEQLLVVAGQEVKQGQPVATLVDADARIALGDAEAAQRLKEAELSAAKAALVAARSQSEHPVHLQAALADAESTLAKIKTEQANLPYAIRASEAKEHSAREELKGMSDIAEAYATLAIQRAKRELEGATAALDELKARGPNLEAEAAALERKCDALRRQLELRSEETRRVAETEAGVQSAEARLHQAELAVQSAKLRLDRMSLRAPIAGRVLALHAQPGRRVAGMAPASEQDASTVVSLYDPARLQVRADVRLEDVPQVQPGQPVEISCAVLSQPLRGRVLTATAVADIQKNTLQVKVAIDDPPQVIKPDMIVQVTFLALEQPGGKSTAGERPLRLLVPRQLVDSHDGSAAVWLADQRTGTARRQAITLGKAGSDALVEVVEGLNPTDKLIVGGREAVSQGDRIRIIAEDTSLGGSREQPSPKVETAAMSPTNIAK